MPPPSGPPYGAPGGQPPYGAGPGTPGYGPAPGDGYGRPAGPWWPGEGQQQDAPAGPYDPAAGGAPYGTPPAGQFGGPPPPGGGRTGLLIGALALVAVLVVGGVVGGALYLMHDSSGHRPAAEAGPRAPVTRTPTTGGRSAEPSATPDESSGDADTGAPGAQLSSDEYDDWHFKLGDVKLDATKTDGKDFDSCTPMAHGSALTDGGCRYGIELDYKAEKDTIRFFHFIMVFDNDDDATSMAHDVTEDDLDMDMGALHADYDTAKWIAHASGSYVVVTACSTDTPSMSDKVDTYLKYSNTDEASALLWRK